MITEIILIGAGILIGNPKIRAKSESLIKQNINNGVKFLNGKMVNKHENITINDKKDSTNDNDDTETDRK